LNTNGNRDRVLSDAQQRLRGVTFIDDAGNTYAPHPDGVEMTPPKPRATADLSSRERSELMDRTVQQVRDLTAACNALHVTCKSLSAQVQTANGSIAMLRSRIGSLEQDAVMLKAHHDGHVQWHSAVSSSFMARIRLLLTGR